MEKKESRERTVIVVRRIARILSLIPIIFLIFFLAAEIISPHVEEGVEVPLIEWVTLAFFPVGTGLALVLAWRWENWGGWGAIATVIVGYALFFTARGEFFPPAMLLAVGFLLLPAVLFILCHRWSSEPGEDATV